MLEDSNPTRGMDVCVRLFCVCVVLSVGRGFATDWSPFQGVPTDYIQYYEAEKAEKGQQKGSEAINWK
jgi:hypothetical protein